MDAAPPGPHPSLETLAAFADRDWSITRRERDEIEAHLVTCAECRRLVAMAFAGKVLP